MDWQLILPSAAEDAAQLDWEAAREVRFRPGQPLMALLPGGLWQGKIPLTKEAIQGAAQALSGYGLAARQKELAQGFLPLPGGHRLGVAGRITQAGMVEISSLCLRLAHECIGVAAPFFPLIQGKNTLIAGPPGAGKTTFLRDCIRLYGLAGVQVGLSDERGEVAACREGVPQLDVGPCCDVVTGLPKSQALPLLIRALAPQIAAADELGGPGDGEAVLEALRCGVTLLVTIHGGSLKELQKRRGMKALWARGAFQKVVLLPGIGQPPRVLSIG